MRRLFTPYKLQHHAAYRLDFLSVSSTCQEHVRNFSVQLSPLARADRISVPSVIVIMTHHVIAMNYHG